MKKLLVLPLFIGLNSPKFQINRGGRSYVQFTYHTLRHQKALKTLRFRGFSLFEISQI